MNRNIVEFIRRGIQNGDITMTDGMALIVALRIAKIRTDENSGDEYTRRTLSEFHILSGFDVLKTIREINTEL